MLPGSGGQGLSDDVSTTVMSRTATAVVAAIASGTVACCLIWAGVFYVARRRVRASKHRHALEAGTTGFGVA